MIARTALRMTLAAISAALAEAPKNSHAWTYTIRGFDSSPYLTRTLLPRLGGHRPMLHRIHREDADPHMHNHPWRTARFLCLSGGYWEERLGPDGRIEKKWVGPGDVNTLGADTFHRISSIASNTWTLGWIGERCQEWGFLVDGAVVPFGEYFARKGHVAAAGSLS